LGDTVSHLKSGQDLKKTFEEAYKCLNPGGLFVLQSRNYDYILKHQARFTPPTGSRNGTEETIFFRLLDFLPRSLNLSVVKFRWHENRWESSVQTTQIYPYLKKDLESTLKSVGLPRFTCYRNFNYEDYDPNGMDLILVAEKKGVLKSKVASALRRDKPALRSGTTKAKPVAPLAKVVKASKPAPRKRPPLKTARRKGKK
jgi:hypothetical protein